MIPNERKHIKLLKNNETNIKMAKVKKNKNKIEYRRPHGILKFQGTRDKPSIFFCPNHI